MEGEGRGGRGVRRSKEKKCEESTAVIFSEEAAKLYLQKLNLSST
jgi:hypothetical protein